MPEQVSGIGLGFRFPHTSSVLGSSPPTPWFEIIADDLMLPSGRLEVVGKLRQRYPLALHSVGLNIAGSTPLDSGYVAALAGLARRFDTAWISDHLCWTAHGARQHFDLLPAPFSAPMLDHIADRVDAVQEAIGQRLALENISYYLRLDADEMSEWVFMAELARRTGCRFVLDLNNLWTNAVNFGRDAPTELREACARLPEEDVLMLHIAGSKRIEHETEAQAGGEYWVDSHGEPVGAGVEALLVDYLRARPGTPVIIERDNNLPPFEVLEAERRRLERSAA